MHPDDGRVVSNFVIQALRGEPITIFGDGFQSRSFCYVDDMIEALIRLMESPDDVVGPVNLGNPAEITIKALAEQVIALTGSASRIEHRPAVADDPVRRRPDIALAKRALDWEPRIPLLQGLTQTIAYFRRELGIGDQ
jgi:UDP-glucuronate decarboxylase